MNKNVVAIIPARGGSKRIKNKNLIPVLNKPLIYYSIVQAKMAKNIADVYVSSDNIKILNYAKSLDCKVIKRPKNLSNDFSSSEETLSHALKQIEKEINVDSVMLLQCTSPIRTSQNLDDAIVTFYEKEADSLISVIRYNRFLWKQKDKDFVSINYDFKKRPRSQDINEQYLETGSFYITKRDILCKYDNRLGGKIVPYEMNFLTNFEIDVSEDITVVEWAFKKYQSEIIEN